MQEWGTCDEHCECKYDTTNKIFWDYDLMINPIFDSVLLTTLFLQTLHFHNYI